jgi:hypothetical protein
MAAAAVFQQAVNGLTVVEGQDQKPGSAPGGKEFRKEREYMSDDNCRDPVENGARPQPSHPLAKPTRAFATASPATNQHPAYSRTSATTRRWKPRIN